MLKLRAFDYVKKRWRWINANDVGGSLPDGWTADDSDPQNIETNGGSISITNGFLFAGSLQSSGPVTGTMFRFSGTGAPRLVWGTTDPTAGVGVSAAIGSLYIHTIGKLWIKTGAAATAWTQMATV